MERPPSPARPRTAAPVEDLGIVDALVQLSFLLQSTLGGVGAAHDLSIVQLRLLGILRDREPAMMEIADHLGIDRSSVTGLVDRAQARDLVERVPSRRDGRGVHVRLTSSGRRLARTLTAEVTAAISQLCEPLTETEQARLGHLASKLLSGAAPQEAG